MLIFLTSIALDITLGMAWSSIAWWATKKITYKAVNYMFYSTTKQLMLTA